LVSIAWFIKEGGKKGKESEREAKNEKSGETF
jgi:hypothetical protein